jgi:hypothetical protein
MTAARSLVSGARHRCASAPRAASSLVGPGLEILGQRRHGDARQRQFGSGVVTTAQPPQQPESRGLPVTARVVDEGYSSYSLGPSSVQVPDSSLVFTDQGGHPDG